MKRSRYTDSQILAILKENEAGAKVSDLCRAHGMSDATFYKWRAKFGGMDASLMKRLRALEDDVHDALISRAHGCARAMRIAGSRKCTPRSV